MKQDFLRTEKEIIEWLDKYNIKNYTLIADEKYGFVVNVNESVDLKNKKLDFILVKFIFVNGAFDCSNNKLTSLEFCPNNVGDYFDCSNNSIIKYIYFPEKIGGNIYLNDGKKYNFAQSFKIHLKDKAEYEKQLLNEKINLNNIDKNNNSFKI